MFFVYLILVFLKAILYSLFLVMEIVFNPLDFYLFLFFRISSTACSQDKVEKIKILSIYVNPYIIPTLY